ncbi:MAG: hypothetical protein ACJ77A_07830 [Actinomycetota bacterium]
MNRSRRSAHPADTRPLYRSERGDVSGQTVALAAMGVAIAALLVVLVMRLTSSGNSAAPPSVSPTGGGAASVFPAARAAADVSTQSNLRNALVAATTYFVEGDTYAGFTAAKASSIEPGIAYTDGGPAATGSVSIRGASADGIVFVQQSDSGQVFCIGKSGAAEVEGKTDAATPGACSGGW